MSKKQEQNDMKDDAIDVFIHFNSNETGTTIDKKIFQVLCGKGACDVTTRIKESPERLKDASYTKNSILLATDGSYLGGIGKVTGDESLIAMEGRSIVLEELSGVRVVPLVLHTEDKDKIIDTLSVVGKSFGGVLLEGIVASKCFEIENELRSTSAVPIFHGERDGVAVSTLAGLINAHKVVKKDIRTSRVAILGAGAVGIGIAKLLTDYGIGDVVVVDKDGIIHSLRTNIFNEKERLAQYTNKEERTGGVLEAVTGADVLIGTVHTGIAMENLIKMMSQQPVVFALAKPVPEILPNNAHNAGAHIVATQDISYPNHISSFHMLPGTIKGIVENSAIEVSKEKHIFMAEKISELVKKPTAKKILPTIFDRRIRKSVSEIFNT